MASKNGQEALLEDFEEMICSLFIEYKATPSMPQ